MPLFEYNVSKNFGKTIIWEIQEPVDFFIKDLIDPNIFPENLHPNRKIEWCALRYLAFQYDGIYPDEIIKDQFGKPQIQNSNLFISFSHSKNYAAYICSSKNVGIDIQVKNEVIIKIAKKFTNQIEVEMFNSMNKVDVLTLIWTAKEATYKLDGKKRLSFLKGIRLNKVTKKISNKLEMSLTIVKNDKPKKVRVHSYVYDGFFLSTAYYS